MSLSIIGHGIMNSSYFSGTNGVMLPIHIDKDTTIVEVIESLEHEISEVWDHIEHVAKCHNFDIENLDNAVNDEIAEIKDYCKDKLDQVYDSSLEWSFDDEDNEYYYSEELPVLIFTIEFK